MTELRVGVAGALGRLGRVACSAIENAAGMRLAAAFARRAGVPAGDRVATDDDVPAFLTRGLDVVVDCTLYPTTVEITRAAVEAGIPVVVGATGWRDGEGVALDDLCRERGVPAMLIPNFSIGAMLMMRFAEQAARVLPHSEIIELHHDTKRDAPSGTARLTAERIRDTGVPLPPIHSIRLPGFVAHQEVIFGGSGERLTIRHDTVSREAYGPGIIAAVRRVSSFAPGVTVGLDAVFDGHPIGEVQARP